MKQSKICLSKNFRSMQTMSPQMRSSRPTSASIELADLVMLCEEKYNLEISDDDIHKFVTVGDVVTYLEGHAN